MQGAARCEILPWSRKRPLTDSARLNAGQGPDLILDGIDKICGQDVQLVMLGSGCNEMEASLPPVQQLSLLPFWTLHRSCFPRRIRG